MDQSKKKFLKNMVGFSMMTWISFLLGFISSPIATRLFVPEELAKFNMFSTYGSLIASVCYLGLDQAYVRFFREPPGKSTRKSLYTFCTLVPLAFSLVAALVLSFFWRSLSVQVMGTESRSVFVQLCLFSFFLVLFRFLSLSYRMEQNAKLYTIQGVCHVVVTKLAYLAVGFDDARGQTAILVLTVLMALFCLACLWLQRSRFDVRFAREIDRPFVQEVSHFALPLAPLAMLSWFNSNANSVVLRNLMGLSENAIYSSALGLAATINIIQTGFNAYDAPYVLEHYQDDSTRFFTIHRLMACLLCLFGLGHHAAANAGLSAAWQELPQLGDLLPLPVSFSHLLLPGRNHGHGHQYRQKNPLDHHHLSVLGGGQYCPVLPADPLAGHDGRGHGFGVLRHSDAAVPHAGGRTLLQNAGDQALPDLPHRIDAAGFLRESLADRGRQIPAADAAAGRESVSVPT